MDPINNTNFILGNFTETKIKKDIFNYFENKIDIIVSDMAQNTTGNKNLDSLITGELCLDALNFAKDIINKNGFFVSKIFMGSNFKEIIDKARNIFKDVKIFKPKSSRKESKENYIICKNLK
jgi:23S rRNA (uridine2552-2'-O)-methyltransferase